MLSIGVNMAMPRANGSGKSAIDHWKFTGDYAAGLGSLDELLATDAESR